MDGLRLAWIGWRNGLLANPRFQRFAADFPLTRRLAHRRTAEIFDLVAGFVYAQILRACVELEIFQKLRGGPLDAEALAQASGASAPTMAQVLRAAAALKLVDIVGERFALGPHGAALLGNSGLLDMIRHHDQLYADLIDAPALIRRGRGERLAGYWPYASSDQPGAVGEAAVAAYSALMAATQPAVAADVLDAYSMRRHRILMDVGGGEGAFVAAIGARWPHLQLRVFDLPAVAARARARAPRAEIFAGDFLADPLPGGADLITLVRILHDHNDEGVARLIANARRALAPGGRLLIAEPMSSAPRLERAGDAYFGIYLLAMGRGQARTPRALRAILEQNGFRRIRLPRVRTPSLLRILVAEASSD